MRHDAGIIPLTKHRYRLYDTIGSVRDRPTASELFLRGIEQIARAFRDAPDRDEQNAAIQATETIRQKKSEHEERKRRVSEAIRNGARISRRDT
jgi:hypothetical protein